jgi:hypothetical protein
VRVVRSSILDQPLMKGLPVGSQGGNFRAKALLESAHALHHTEVAMLPGQIGQDPDHTPESNAALSRYNRDIVAAAARLSPERQALLRLPFVPFSQYAAAIAELYDLIDRRIEHRIEGWEESGFVTSEYRLASSDNHWFPMTTLLTMSAEHRAATEAVIQAPGLCRTRRLSPREVWRAGQPALVRLSQWAVPLLLGPRNGIIRPVGHDRLIEFEDRALWGPGKQRFLASVETPHGARQALAVGASYMIHFNQLDPAKAYISDPADGRVLGVAQRWGAPCRGDAAAVRLMQAAQRCVEAQSLACYRARHADAVADHQAMLAHNEAVLAGAPITKAEHVVAARIGAQPGDLDSIYARSQDQDPIPDADHDSKLAAADAMSALF